MREGPSFAQRILCLRKPLLALARRTVRDPGEAEDILQAALTAAYRTRASYDGVRPFKAWLAGFVVLVARNHNRKRRALPLPDPDQLALPEQLEAESSYERILEDPEAALEHVGARLFRAVFRLRREEREVFLLRALLDLSYRDLAAVCSIPVGTVMSRLHRARATLRAALASEEARR